MSLQENNMIEINTVITIKIDLEETKTLLKIVIDTRYYTLILKALLYVEN